MAAIATSQPRSIGDPKRVLIICQLDRASNGVKPLQIERYLNNHGHQVTVANTYYLGRAAEAGSWRRMLPPASPKRLALYLVEALSVIQRRWGFTRRRLSYPGFVADLRLRRSILASSLDLDDFDLVICETPHDAGVLTVPMRAQTLYDCPTPWADELFNDGKLTERQHRKLRCREMRIFEGVDYLAFWWPSYAHHAVEEYGISGRNLVTLNYGCEPSSQRATFRDPPRVVYLGALRGGAINLPLLSRLSSIYPHIDVYGGPPPDHELGLNYRGWSEPAVLANYQIGLITSSDDILRRNGFSAKHPQYLGYGLPVLVPSVRRHMDLLRGSVPYDETTFLAAIERLSDRAEWQRVSNQAYAQAQLLAWDVTLEPLLHILAGDRSTVHAGTL